MPERLNDLPPDVTETPAGVDEDIHVGRRWSGPVLVLSPVGTVDTLSAPTVLTAVLEAARRSTLVVVDLAGVTFLDCAGLGALVAAHHRAQERGGSVQVAAPTPTIRLLLSLFGLEDLLGGTLSVAEQCRRSRRDGSGPPVSRVVPATPRG